MDGALTMRMVVIMLVVMMIMMAMMAVVMMMVVMMILTELKSWIWNHCDTVAAIIQE